MLNHNFINSFSIPASFNSYRVIFRECNGYISTTCINKMRPVVKFKLECIVYCVTHKPVTHPDRTRSPVWVPRRFAVVKGPGHGVGKPPLSSSGVDYGYSYTSVYPCACLPCKRIAFIFTKFYTEITPP
jgi:hypothetical protein